MPDRLLLNGGYVVSLDPEIGDINGGDVLIEGDTIAAVAPEVEATGAEVIDVTGDVVIPGFIDSHRHTWETSIRGTAPNATLDDYFGIVLDGFAKVYRPEDVYVANYMGALECINAGVTTLLDWSHIQNTPDHSDQAIRGLQETGIRSVFAYGFPNTSLADWWYNSSLKTPDDVRRVRENYFSSDDGLITMALATRGPGFTQPDVVKYEWTLARELDLPITVHVGMGRVAGRFSMVSQLNELGLLGPDTTYVHSCYLSEEEWKLVADTGGKVSIAAQVELQMGHGCPPTLRARDLGLRPSLSVDVVTTVPGDMFTEMRAMFGSERFGVNAECWTADVDVPDTMLDGPRRTESRNDRRCLRLRTRGPNRLPYSGQEGRRGGHRRQEPQRSTDRRSGCDGSLVRRRVERGHRHHRRQDPQAERPFGRGLRSPARATRGVA